MRVEEVEDSEDYEQGVDLDLRYAKRRLASDDLHFTGVDLGNTLARRRRPFIISNLAMSIAGTCR